VQLLTLKLAPQMIQAMEETLTSAQVKHDRPEPMMATCRARAGMAAAPLHPESVAVRPADGREEEPQAAGVRFQVA
jgi:hypothetical protein